MRGAESAGGEVKRLRPKHPLRSLRRRVAKAIRTAPWRNLEDEEEAEDEGGGEDPVRDPPARKPVMGKSKILAAALASVVSATPKRTPKKRIIRAGRIGSAVAAHKGAPRFRQRQALRRKLGEELLRGSVGEALARGLLDSDCESCSGRRRTSHIAAAVRATDYVRKVRAALAAKKAATAAAAARKMERRFGSRRMRTPIQATCRWARRVRMIHLMGLEASKVVWGRRSP